jgi:hypothetical protein
VVYAAEQIKLEHLLSNQESEQAHKQMQAVQNQTPPAQEGGVEKQPQAPTGSHPAAAEQVPSLAAAGNAFHDGSEGHKLGEGDEVFDEKGHIKAVFPTSPDGVVMAALYELHRGDQRRLADAMADPTKDKTMRGSNAAIGGGVKYGAAAAWQPESGAKGQRKRRAAATPRKSRVSWRRYSRTRR